MKNLFVVASVKHHAWGSVATFTPQDPNNPAQSVAVTFNPDEAIRGLQPGAVVAIEFKAGVPTEQIPPV